MSTLHRICTVEELPPGARRVLPLTFYEEVLILNVDGTIYAISNLCPHEGAALQRGPVTGTVLSCPLHRWSIDLTSGRCVDEATLCSPTYQVEIHDQALFLRLPAVIQPA